MSLKTLYIARNGAYVYKEALRFIIRYQGEVIQEVPIHSIGQMVLIGKVEMTHDAIILAHRHEIDVLYLSQKGDLKAHLFPYNQKLIVARKKQYEVGERRSIQVARGIIQAKLRNARTVLMKYERRSCEELGNHTRELKSYINRVKDTQTIGELRGLEGISAKIYYQAMGLLLKQELGFKGRNRRPPRDPVNAMLSFGYVMLYQRVARAIGLYGLDPYLGHLHEPKDRRLSLALDLMEEFRSIIVDRAVLSLVNRVVVTCLDFEKTDEGGVRMNSKAIACLVKEFESRMEQVIHYPPLGKDLPWKYIIQKQVGIYRRMLFGEMDQYEGFVVR